jgi:hypothetical protein
MSHVLVMALSFAAMLVAFAGLAIGIPKGLASEALLPVMLAAAVPYALILVFAFTGARHRAYALAIGAASVAFICLILFAAVFTIFLGFAMGNKDQIAFVLLLDVFVVIQLPLGVAAWKARRALASQVRSRGDWGIGWALPLVVAASVAAWITGVQDHSAKRINSIYRNEDAARQALERVSACLKLRAANDAGFPASLDAVGPGGTKCLDAGTAAGKLGGHRLSYWAGAPDASGKVRLYSLCAEATDYRQSAWRTYVSDESSAALFLEPHEAMRDPYTCSQAWMRDPVRRVKHCLVAYASRHGGYPRALDEVGSGTTGCLAPSPLESTRISPAGFHASDTVVGYRPGTPDAQGRITAFELHGPGFVPPHRFNVMIDETGATYAAKGRDAARGDPAPAAFAIQLEGQQATAMQERERLWKACDGGAAEVCTRLGLSVIDGESWGSADQYWRRGCEHGSAMSCVLATRQSDFDVFILARDGQRDCDAGKPEGCERIKKLARDYRACNGAEPDGCHGLARRIARAGNTHKANTYWDKGCKAGHAESCYFLSVRDFVYVNAMKLADACDAGGSAQCTELKRQVAEMKGPR